jgi:hypothetical protein
MDELVSSLLLGADRDASFSFTRCRATTKLNQARWRDFSD